MARAVSKRYSSGMAQHVKSYLADVGFFTNRFQTQVMEQDVLPWLEQATVKFVGELEDFGMIPDGIIGELIKGMEQEHTGTVEAEQKRKENVRKEEDRMQKEKMNEEMKRKMAKDA